MTGGWLRAHVAGRRIEFAPDPLPAQPVQGSLMLEVTLARGEAGPLPLVLFETKGPDRALLSIALGIDGRIELVTGRGRDLGALSLSLPDELSEGGTLRLSWTWNVARNYGLLSCETAGRGALRQRGGAVVMPLTGAEIEILMSGRSPARISPRCDWIAFGTQIQPAGPGACFAPATPIETPQGPRPASQIRAGDMVLTADAGAQAVLWSGALRLPALGELRPVRLLSPAFGASTDLWVAANHRVAVSGPGVEYLFGEETVLVEARHLVDSRAATRPDGGLRAPGVLGWRGILLKGHHLLLADGCAIESLAIGSLARQAALAATTAPGIALGPEALPLHDSPPRRTLRPFEAAALVAQRARNSGPVAA